MKALKYIGLAVLVIVIAAGIATGGYFLALGTQANKQTTQENNTSSANSDSSNTSRPTHEQAPPKPTALTTCNADELKLTTQESSDSGAGTLAIDIVLTNTGGRECTLGGFPGVSLVNGNGNMVGKPAERATNYPEKTVTLAPNAKATATISYEQEGNFDSGTCVDGATKVRVYPPNDTGYISIAQTAITSWCPGFETSPVR